MFHVPEPPDHRSHRSLAFHSYDSCKFLALSLFSKQVLLRLGSKINANYYKKITNRWKWLRGARLLPWLPLSTYPHRLPLDASSLSPSPLPLSRSAFPPPRAPSPSPPSPFALRAAPGEKKEIGALDGCQFVVNVGGRTPPITKNKKINTCRPTVTSF